MAYDIFRSVIILLMVGFIACLWYRDFGKPRLRKWHIRRHGVLLQDPLSMAFAFRQARPSPRASFVLVDPDVGIEFSLCGACCAGHAWLTSPLGTNRIYAVPHHLLESQLCDFCHQAGYPR